LRVRIETAVVHRRAQQALSKAAQVLSKAAQALRKAAQALRKAVEVPRSAVSRARPAESASKAQGAARWRSVVPMHEVAQRMAGARRRLVEAQVVRRSAAHLRARSGRAA
jgi:hypothetical protein